MLRTFLASIPGLADPRLLSATLKFSVAIIIGATIWLWLRSRSDREESQFRAREADLPRKKRFPGEDPLASARMRRKEPPLALPGIRTEGLPHQILGVKPDASRQEIQAAYHQLMKRFHPDKRTSATAAQLKDAQRIAGIINRAKDELLKNRAGK